MILPVFVISTHYNTSRHKHIEEQLIVRHGVELAVVMAIDWRLLQLLNGLSEAQCKHLSLVLAYQQICQMAIFHDLLEFIIFEDDIMIQDIELIDSLSFITPDDYDICYLTRTDHNKKSAVTEPFDSRYDKIISNWWETPATCWSIQFAKRFNEHILGRVENKETWFGHIDHLLLQLNQGRHYGAKQCTAVGLSTERKYAPNGFKFEGSIS